jgi:hypothetical protein
LVDVEFAGLDSQVFAWDRESGWDMGEDDCFVLDHCCGVQLVAFVGVVEGLTDFEG